MASVQVVETSVNYQQQSSSQDYTTNPDDHSNHNNFFTPTLVYAYTNYYTHKMPLKIQNCVLVYYTYE